MKTELRVAVIFEAGKIKPVWVGRRGTRINVAKINYEWETHFGEDLIRHFAFSNDRSSYELAFNARTLIWTFSYSGR